MSQRNQLHVGLKVGICTALLSALATVAIAPRVQGAGAALHAAIIEASKQIESAERAVEINFFMVARVAAGRWIVKKRSAPFGEPQRAGRWRRKGGADPH